MFSRLVVGFDVQDGFALAVLAPGRLNEIPGGLNVFSNGLNKYVHEWIKHMFPFLDRMNISVIGLKKYFGDWIEQIFQ